MFFKIKKIIVKDLFRIFIIIFLFFTSLKADTNLWVGKWIAMDKWKSEFTIELNKDGTAFSDYANGTEGSWKLVDGNAKISWDNGKSDFIFIGVMGYQRLHKSKQSSYTAGIKKKLPN
jgi:hypothetical protein